jgi:predicted O-linked N-acetylglucosamine transferase (SPINDLY family)
MSDSSGLQRLAADFSSAAERYAKAPDPAQHSELRTIRLAIATMLRDLPVSTAEQTWVGPLHAIAASCLQTDIRHYPRTSAESKVLAQCLDRSSSWKREQLAGSALAALLLSWHAAELDFVPPLAALQPASLKLWLYFLLETPLGFVNIGDADKYAAYLEQLCERIAEYLKQHADPSPDLVTAFMGSSVFVQSYFNQLNLRNLMRLRGSIIERILELGGHTLDQLRVLRPARERPRIGFLALRLADGTETVYLAAHMERLDRRRYDVRLYSAVQPTGKAGSLCRAAAERYELLSGNLREAVAQLRRDDLDMAIFCSNLTGNIHLLTQIAAHRVARIQSSSGASPVTTGLRNVDLMISSAINEISDSSEHYTERLLHLSRSINCYPFHYIMDGATPPPAISRQAVGVEEDAILFFSASTAFKILPEVILEWMNILRRVPRSQLLLMPFNPNWGTDRLQPSFLARLTQHVTEAGLAPHRVRVLPPVPTIAHLHKVMALADIYLDAFPYSGACSISDAIQVDLPMVTRAGKVCRSLHTRPYWKKPGSGIG